MAGSILAGRASCAAGVVTFTASVLAGTSARATLTAFYPFEGNANDVSGNDRHASVSGATLTPAGFQGQAFDFDGVDDYLTTLIDLNAAHVPRLTIGAWVNADSADQIKSIISHDDGGFDRALTLDDRGAGTGFRYSANTGAGVLSTGPDPAPVGTWVFVAARYDAVGSFMTLDVDASRVSIGAIQAGSSFTANIGRNPGFGEYFDGRI